MEAETLNSEEEFMHKLALELGMTVNWLKHNMTASEYANWKRFYKKNLFTQEREEIRHGQLMSKISNMIGAKTKPSDFWNFMPKPNETDSLGDKIRRSMNRFLDFAKGIGNG